MNSFGTLFKISIFGESHGIALGMVIDGCPAGLLIKFEDFIEDFNRRRSGAKGTTPRKESDIPKIVSGVFNNRTTGAPITILFENTNIRSRDYTKLRETPRPGHADFVAMKKYGGFEGGSTDIEKAIDRAVEEQDSIGGIIECKAINLPVGLGEPFFDSVEAVLGHMIFSIPAIKGIEFGSGFSAAKMKGSMHNDNIISADGKTETNHAGGINGGITNGNELVFRVPVKPTSSTHQKQRTINMNTGEMEDLEIEGRHDTCIALRVPVVVEAATAVVLADFMLRAGKMERILNI